MQQTSEETLLATQDTPERTTSDVKPRVFGDYELIEELGQGGMGIVYKARQISLNRVVALKTLLAGQLAGEAEVKRFRAEAEAAANLDHPNIVDVHEIGLHDGQYFFSMQFIEGRSLAELQPEGFWRTQDGKVAARLAAKVARAVQFAHEHGVLHRDLKPGNILVDAVGEPHVSDFGLARRIGGDSSLTVEGAVLGTPSFMPPEQAAGRTSDLGPEADIYSVGAILYFLLTGRPPFSAVSALDTLVQVLQGEVIVPRVINSRISPDLNRICLRCLEKAKERRYRTAAELAEDLERFLQGDPVRARVHGLRSLLLYWLRSQPALACRLLGLAVCLVIAQLTFLFYPSLSLAQHFRILSALGAWALLSVICQALLARERWTGLVPYLWVLLDFVCLTGILWLDEAIPGPLVGCFPVLIAASGLWFKPLVVGAATVLAMAGYSVLIAADVWRGHPLEQANWHIAFQVMLILTGCVVAYQVHRSAALNRFYNNRR